LPFQPSHLHLSAALALSELSSITTNESVAAARIASVSSFSNVDVGIQTEVELQAAIAFATAAAAETAKRRSAETQTTVAAVVAAAAGGRGRAKRQKRTVASTIDQVIQFTEAAFCSDSVSLILLLSFQPLSPIFVKVQDQASAPPFPAPPPASTQLLQLASAQLKAAESQTTSTMMDLDEEFDFCLVAKDRPLWTASSTQTR
jgi:hypothetical protein